MTVSTGDSVDVIDPEGGLLYSGVAIARLQDEVKVAVEGDVRHAPKEYVTKQNGGEKA